MEKVTRCFMSVLLLSAVLSSALAEEKFFGEGGSLELGPNFSGDIQTVTWKLNNDMVAEWLKKFDDLTYYSTFKGRTTLDKETGTLNMTKLTPADSGEYSVEINNMVRPERYNVKVIKEVPQPVVELKPLTCSRTSDSCNLVCEGNTKGAEPFTYSWKMGDKEWMNGEKNRTITKDTETKRVETFSCQIKNPISEKQSDPIPNIFYDKNAVDGVITGARGSGVGGVIVIIIAVVLVLPIVIIVVLVKLGKLKLEDIRRRLPWLTCLPGGGVGNKDEEAERQPLDDKSNAAGTANGSPIAETIAETKAGADGERDAAADGERDAGADGERDAAAGGECDAAAGGERDAAAGGERDAGAGEERDVAAGGERDAAADGERGAASDGEHNAGADGERDAGAGGERDAAADGGCDAAADGGRDAAADGERDAAADGERDAAADGERDAVADGERDAASGGERDPGSDAASKADGQSSAESGVGTGREHNS